MFGFRSSRVIRPAGNTVGGGASAQEMRNIIGAWFPVNPPVADIILGRIQKGSYDSARPTLIDHLKKDLSLFAHGLRDLHKISGQHDDGKNPIETIKNLSTEQLKKLFSIDPSDCSGHDFFTLSRQQALTLKYAQASCVATEKLARHVGIDGDLAFACALLRQLGIILFAFNSSRLYSTALSRVRSGTSTFNDEMKANLKFTNYAFAQLIAQDWKISKVFTNTVNFQTQVNLTTNDLHLGKICRYGEKVGLVCADVLPSHSSLRKKYIGEIDKLLGQQGFQEIESWVLKHSVTYNGTDKKGTSPQGR